ncbi:MAG: alpha/beta hydrolase [Bacteroidia bacterium]|nr:alpha/beta hydrolase [Bacteroidia bacterium]
MFQEHLIRLGKYDINYVDEGEGEVMLFLHNGGGFWQIWEHQLRYFSQTHRVIALDWVGFGESSVAEEPQTLALYEQVLQSFVNALALPSFFLVGNCIGASVALSYWQTHPDRVRAMVLMNICPGERMIRIPLVRRFLLGPAKEGRLRRTVEAIFRLSLQLPIVKARFPRILFGPTYSPTHSLAQHYLAKYKQARQTAGRLNLLFALRSFTLSSFLRSPLPSGLAIMIWGVNNQVVSLQREANHHLDLLGIKEMSNIAAGGHLCMYEFPVQINHLIEQHIQEYG